MLLYCKVFPVSGIIVNLLIYQAEHNRELVVIDREAAEGGMLEVFPLPGTGCFLARSARRLPRTLTVFIAPPSLLCGSSTADFVAGASFSGRRTANGAAHAGHYKITSSPRAAVFGVYRVLPRPEIDTRPDPIDVDDMPTTEDERPDEDDGDARLVTFLQTVPLGTRIAMQWRRREEMQERWRTWVGTTTTRWCPQVRNVSVRWDGAQPELRGRRERPLPEAQLPDPTLVYGRIETLSTPLTTTTTATPTAPLTSAKTATAATATPQAPQTSAAPQVRVVTQTQRPAEAMPRAPPHELLAADIRPKNWTGDPSGGRSCPRTWFLHASRPPHVSAAVTPETRRAHLHWLRELRSMPADLLRRPLPLAALELVRRTAAARNHKWSTIARALASIRGALLALPLYTAEPLPIDVGQHPEWRAATATCRRMDNETPPAPPPPITKDQYALARKHLRTEPQAEAFLALMWSFAARAADVAGLNAGDVVLESRGRVAATMRRGKGAKFRGPYPVASTASQEDLALFRRVLAPRRHAERMFAGVPAIRRAITQALTKVLPGSALPSVRKGAARHLVTSGAPEEEVARLTGHTRLDTLRRYLGYAEVLTAEARAAQERTRPLALGPPHMDGTQVVDERARHQIPSARDGEPPVPPNSEWPTKTFGRPFAPSRGWRREHVSRRSSGPST